MNLNHQREMGHNLRCVCQSNTSLEPSELQRTLQDANFRKHLEDVLDPKAYVRDKKVPVTFEKTTKENLVKCGSGKFSGVAKRNPVRLKEYKIEEDHEKLKVYLDQNEESIQVLGKSPHELRKYEKQFRNNIKKGILWKDLKASDYFDNNQRLLWIEEHHEQKELQRHNLRDVTLAITDQNDGSVLYGIDVGRKKVLGLSDGRPSLLKDDFIHIHKQDDLVYEGRIKVIEKQKDRIYVELDPTKFKYQIGEIISVEFKQNRRSHQLCHRALEQLMKNPALYLTLFPKKGPKQLKQSKKSMPIELEFFNEKIKNDAKQVQAIKCILGKTCGSAPYILNGPPGTGKTATLVEVIHQLLKRESTGRICICAPSNPAVDVIVKRLLGLDRLEDERPILPSELQENVIRVYAKNAERDEDLEDYSTNEVNIGDLIDKRIIATTTLTSGWLIDKGVGKGWFEYLFIDEAGQATEPNILIPISGFQDKNCFLVLAGDPKQLGPVVTSPLARAAGLDISLIERLQLPKSEALHGGESNRTSLALTTLKNNYRSHPRIIDIPNRLFYNGQLRAEGESKKIRLASDSNWEHLSKRNNNFPIIFHGVTGIQRNSGQSPSNFNVNEIVVIGNYIEDLLGQVWNGVEIVPDYIGIISPYRTQVEMIKKYLNHRHWNSIRAGSIESFQGSEKLIIFISTVRSKKAGSEFIRNQKRFNVAITRAMALLIIVGDPEVLYMKGTKGNPNHWRDLIDECYRFHSCKGILPKELQKISL